GAAGPVKLPNNDVIATLIGYKFALEAARNKVDDQVNDREISRGQINALKDSLLVRLNQFNEKMRAFASQTPYINALPKVFNINEAEAKILKPLNDMRSLWTKVNDVNLPVFNNADLILLGNYTLAAYTVELTALKKAFEEYESDLVTGTLARSERDDLQERIYALLKSYRLVLPTYFAADAAMVESMPRLTVVSERLPAAVVLQGAWDVATSKAKLTFAASTDVDLEKYEMRVSPGPIYDAELENVLAEISPAGPFTLSTDNGFDVSGKTFTYRLYVILTTGTERGSNEVAIVRP
ncbi:MAG: hypothetical protein ACRC6G_11645, partial [Deefgea sp.]